MARLTWFLLAMIHALPAIVLVSPSLLATLYGVEPDSPAYTLLWHRAALFAVILVDLLWSRHSS